MNEIVYLSMIQSEYPTDGMSPLKLENVKIITPPTKCNVTINGSYRVKDVYVDKRSDDSSLYLFNNYSTNIEGLWGSGGRHQYPIFKGSGLVLEFKSDNYIIEASI